MNKIGAYLIGALVLAGLLSYGGYRVHEHIFDKGFKDADGKCTTKIAEIESRAMEAERNANAQREKGRIVSDRLAKEVADLRVELFKAQERTQREIDARTSTTRKCFGGSVARLLNTPVKPEPVASGDPASPAPAGTVAEVAAPEADRDGPSVSERSAANSLNEARTGYESCRTQLHALIDWAKEVTGI